MDGCVALAVAVAVDEAVAAAVAVASCGSCCGRAAIAAVAVAKAVAVTVAKAEAAVRHVRQLLLGERGKAVVPESYHKKNPPAPACRGHQAARDQIVSLHPTSP